MRYEIWRNLDEILANTRINLHDIIYNYANLLGAKFDVLNFSLALMKLVWSMRSKFKRF